MRTEEVKIYKFNELSEESKEKAIEYFSKAEYEDSNLLEFWAEDWNYQIEERFNIDNIKLHYSLGYCQGDGVSIEFENSVLLSEFKYSDPLFSNIKDTIWDFTEKIYDMDFLSKGNIEFIMDSMQNTGIETHKNSDGYHYSHNKTIECDTIDFCDIDFFEYNSAEDMGISEENAEFLYNTIIEFCMELEWNFTEFLQNISSEIETSGYNEIEYRTGKECITELIECNDYEFYENGELY